jgi:type III secretion system chaperone SycN
MSWVNETLAQFGQQLGLPLLELGTHGVAQLELQAGGVLAVEPAPGNVAEVLVYLGRPLGFEGGAVLRNALSRAHHGNAHPMPVQVAVRGDGPEALLLVLVRVSEGEFTPQTLGRVVEYLGRWSDGAHHG